MKRTARFGYPTAAALATLTGLLVLGGSASAATTWTVHVGRGGNQFVDEASGTNVSTIQPGDTVTWIWEGSMQHSVTSGTCPGNHGGGGGYVTTGGSSASPKTYGTGDCVDSAAWQTAGLQGSGFTFSHTFTAVGTTTYFCAMHQSAMTGKVIVQGATATGPCVVDTHTLCLGNERFKATAHWVKTDGSSGDGNAIALTDDSGYFWFFDSANIEAVVKVLNGCAINSNYWVFAAGLTDVAVHLTVVDTATGATYTRDNPQGTPFTPVQDTKALPTSCP